MAGKAPKAPHERVVIAVDHDELELFLRTTPIPPEKFALVRHRIDVLIVAVRNFEMDIGITPEGELLVKRASEAIVKFLEAAGAIDELTASFKQIETPRRRYMDDAEREFYVPEVGEIELRRNLVGALTKVFSPVFLNRHEINFLDFMEDLPRPGTRQPLRDPFPKSRGIQFNEEGFRSAVRRDANPITVSILHQIAEALRKTAKDLEPKKKGGGPKDNPIRDFLLANIAELWVGVFDGQRAAYVKDTNPFVDFAEGICALLKVSSYSTEHHVKEALKPWRARRGRKLPPKNRKLSPKPR
jgi:hypothetical protein